MADPLKVAYRSARTVVTVNGTVKVSFGDHGQRLSTERTSIVTLGVEADPATSHHFELEHELLHGTREFDLHLTADGRLTEASYENTGAGGQLIGAIAHVASLVATLLPAATALMDAIAGPSDSSTLPEEIQAKLSSLGERKNQLAQLIDRLQARLITIGTETAQATGSPAGTLDQLKALESLLASARTELSDVDQALNTCRATYLPDEVTTCTYTVGLDDLPARAQADGSIQLDVSSLPGELGQAARNLQTVVVRIEAPSDPIGPSNDTAMIIYRLPRRIQLAVYEMLPTAEDPKDGTTAGIQQFHLRQVLPAWVLDSRSQLGSIPVTAGLFGKHGSTLGFGETGTLAHLSNKESSVVGDVAAALSAAGGDITAGLEQGGKIRAALPAPQDPTLVALRAELARKQLEANIVSTEETIAKGKLGLG